MRKPPPAPARSSRARGGLDASDLRRSFEAGSEFPSTWFIYLPHQPADRLYSLYTIMSGSAMMRIVHHARVILLSNFWNSNIPYDNDDYIISSS